MEKSKQTGPRLKIACEGADSVDWRSLNRLQGELKVMDEVDRARLRESIVNFGFSFAVDAWREPGKKGGSDKIWIMDAHQRIDIIEELANEGWEIPPLPVSWVHARNREEAMKKLAAAASQYGRVTPQGLFDFMKAASISVESLQRSYRFPEIDMEKFKSGFFPEVSNVSFSAKKGGEIDEESLGEFKHACPKCGFKFD